MVLTRKYTPSKQVIDSRIRVSARDEYPFTCRPTFIPKHRDAMGGVFTVEADDPWHQLGSDVFQTNEADASDGVASVQLRAETGGDMPLHDIWVYAEVGEDAPADYSVYGG